MQRSSTAPIIEVYEGLDHPVILLDQTGRIAEINDAAMRYCASLKRDMLWSAWIDKHPVDPSQSLVLTYPLKHAPYQIIMMIDAAQVLDETQKRHDSEKIRMLGEFAGNVAHEIRNPLAGLKILSKLKNHTEDDWRSVERQVQKMENILNHHLAFSKSNQVMVQSMQVAEVLQSVLESLKHAMSGVTLRIQGDASQSVSGSREGIECIVSNLIKNAIEASTKPCMIDILIEEQGEHLCLHVKDYGAGTNKTLRELVERQFTTKTYGHGLGLALVHAIVTAHGGTLCLEKNAPSGCIFSISLPASTQVRDRHATQERASDPAC